MNRGFPIRVRINFSLEWLLVGAIALAILLRLLNLGSREFWYDEALSLLLSTGKKIAYQDPPDIPIALTEYRSLLRLPVESSFQESIATVANVLRGLVGSEPHPPLFFLSQHVWLRLFGYGEVAMRSLGALLSIVAVFSAYGLGRVIVGHRGGLLLAALLATNPFYLFHSLNVRMYASLVLWTILSAWAMLEKVREEGEWGSGGAREQGSGGAEFIFTHPLPITHYPLPITHYPIPNSQFPIPNSQFPIPNSQSPFIWDILLIGSVASGLLTFYLFVYWIMALMAVVIYLDRQRWWQHGVRLGAGVLLSIPWMIWGIPQQLRNADFKRFEVQAGFIKAGMQHLQDVIQTLGIHLLLGDWVTSLPHAIALLAGIVAIALLVTSAIGLWRVGERRLLGLALLLGIFPLFLLLLTDVITGKFAVGFGWGRSIIFILPGCLLLLVVWIERALHYKKVIVSGMLLLYLSIGISDFSFRQRQVFHKIADVIAQTPETPTLIAMNSKAWGHSMRLAYYLPATAPVMLLAQESDNLAPTLEKVLRLEAKRYSRIIWLESAAPVWSPPASPTEKQKIERILKTRFQWSDRQVLKGTMDLDEFTLNLYTRVSPR